MNATARRAAAGLRAVFFLEAFAFASWLTRLPEIKAALDLSEGRLGLILLALPAGSVPMTLVAGALTLRWSPRRLNLLAMGAMSAGIVGIGSAGTVEALLASLLLTGFGAGGMGVAMNHAGFTHEARTGRPVLSSCHGCFSLGLAGGGSAGAVAIALGTPVMPHLGATVALCYALFVTAALTLPTDVERGERARLALPGRKLALPAALAFAALMAEGSTLDWAAIHMRTVLGAEGAAVGLSVTAFALGMAAVRFAGDVLSRRLAPRDLLAVAAAVNVLGAALIVSAQGATAALLGFAAAGAGLAVMVPVVFREAAARSPGAPGLGVAAASTVGYLGFLLGPPLMGFLAEAASLRASFAALGVVVLLAGIAARRL